MNDANQKPRLTFDIETGPRPEVSANPGEWFRPDARLTDPVKIRASLAEKCADGAALSPITGQILAIGYGLPTGGTTLEVVGEFTEVDLVDRFFARVRDTLNRGGQLVGFNCGDFDLPFILFRAAVHRIAIPSCIGTRWKGRWQFADNVVDLMTYVQFGRYERTGYSLDKVCRAMGLPPKSGNGAMFAELLASNPQAAREYLAQDIACTVGLANRLLGDGIGA
jgi:predicted PolB exonuclease-like 3'-5' exonuclease